ncbi:uncharacterized protein LOC119655948 isoform X1 [Hermetia illucens]|uniref:uncharacterized protein LOC119655948 isoform X1 n=1 Tax=Hermetia illucens TaxID=343691 RepID=UPI0018CC2B2C|nr:uncharacterized protein LOC119655948 isoform X1 [Hermetia illucens]
MSWENYKSDTSGDVMVGKFEVFIDMNKSKGNQSTGGRSKGVPSMSGNIVVPEKLNSNSNWSDTSLDQSPLDFLLDDEFNLNSTHNLEMAIKNITNPSPEHDIGKLKGRDVLLSQTIKSENNDFVLTPLQSTSAPTSEVIKPEPAAVVDSSGDAKSQNQTPHFVKYINRDGKVIKVWECGICSRNFQHQYTLMRHLPTHTNVRNFVCNECGKAFRQLSTLSQHRAIHSVERPYACETCNKSFNRISTLISHRKTHSDVKPFRCHMCHKGFHQKGNLRNHIYIHTNERPYRCTVCNKGFNQMSNLVCHTQKSHSSEFGSIWTCDRCNMSFSKRTLLRAHELETHHIQGTNIKSTRPKLANNRKSATTTSDDSTMDLDAGNEFCKSEISENGILIPAIDTDAMKIARANKEMPFAVLHFFEGPPLLVRIVDYGNQSLLRPTKNEDFISLKNQQAEQIEKVCVPIVAAVYQTLNVAGRPEFKVMPPKNIYKFINHHQSISLNCDNNNEGEREASKPDEIIPAANIISLTPPQIPSDLRDVTENLETPLFESLTHVKDEPSNMDENSMEFNPGASMGEKPRAIAIVEESNWWKRHTKTDPYEEVDAFSETFQNIATGSLLTPKKITESDIMPDQNASILDLSEARNPLLCHGQQISNNNNDNIFNYNSLMNYDFGNNISNILDAFRSEGMDASMIKSLFSENPGLLHDFNECLSEILP